jgi:hypothetical protein
MTIDKLTPQLPNGDKDGGLKVLEGSFALYTEFFEAHDHEKPADGWSWNDGHGYDERHMQWFYDRGCKWKKVNAEPGDVVLWDSRCIHYGASPEGDKPRVAICESFLLLPFLILSLACSDKSRVKYADVQHSSLQIHATSQQQTLPQSLPPSAKK